MRAEKVGSEIEVWTTRYDVQGENEKEDKNFFDYYDHEKGDWVAATNLVETLGINAQTLPPEVLRDMKIHFMAGWGGYPLIGTSEQSVGGLRTICQMGFDCAFSSLAALIVSKCWVPGK